MNSSSSDISHYLVELSVEVSNDEGQIEDYPNIIVDFETQENYEIYDGDSLDTLITQVNEILPEDYYVNANYTTCGFDVYSLDLDYEKFKNKIDLVAEMIEIQPEEED